MTEKDKKPLEQETESILDFEDAKEMTIGQANRKAEEIEAGVTEGDNVLDKYISRSSGSKGNGLGAENWKGCHLNGITS